MCIRDRYKIKGTQENIHRDSERYNPILERYGITERGDIIGKHERSQLETEKELYYRLGLGKEYDAKVDPVMQWIRDNPDSRTWTSEEAKKVIADWEGGKE